VYAFGVVVLEMMTGMQAVDARRPTGCEALPQLLQPALQAVQLMQVTCILPIVSVSMQHEYPSQHQHSLCGLCFGTSFFQMGKKWLCLL